ncbi:MAG: winged helix-turn-helix domain-containing protein [Chloroflexi bacterium]|nr:winged helix-turn-helix domain-containing protein [Chloroflexota bacterium]
MRTAINSIRRKLSDDAANPTYIFTEARVGYRMGRPEPLDEGGDRTPSTSYLARRRSATTGAWLGYRLCRSTGPHRCGCDARATQGRRWP